MRPGRRRHLARLRAPLRDDDPLTHDAPPPERDARAVLRTWGLVLGAGFLLLAAERGVLAVRHGDGAPADEVLASFLHGLRFDAAGLAYLVAPAWLLSLLTASLLRRRTEPFAGAAVLATTTLLAAAEIPFFAEFRSRLDFVALEYLDDPGEALSLAVASVGVARVVLAVVVVAAVFAGARAVLRRASPAASARVSLPAHAGIAVLLFLAARGGTGRPLRPQDADRSAHPLVNELDLSPAFTLARHAYEWATDEAVALSDWTPRRGPRTDGAEAAADLVRPEPLRFEGPSRPDWNVVVLLLESFAARHTGACGAIGADAWTPEFDRHTTGPGSRARLFRNAWASGPSTNRAVPAVFASFPSVPARLAITKSALGNQPFVSLPIALTGGVPERRSTLFLSGGAPSWENLGGWLRQQGFAEILGREDFPGRPPAGPPDAVLLARVLAECDARAASGRPFLVAALTATNHPPFDVPRTLAPLSDEPSPRPADARERAMRYADAALGRFLDAALARPWAGRTLFVLVGDHGFHVAPQAEIDPDRHRVPLAVIAGSPLPGTAAAPGVSDELTAQTDILPLVTSLVRADTVVLPAFGRVPDAPGTRSPAPRRIALGPHGGARVAAAVEETEDGGLRYLVLPLDGRPAQVRRLTPGTGRLVPAPDGPGEDAARDALAAWLRNHLGAAHRALLSRTASGE